MTNRLKSILKNIISPEQHVFILGREIIDSIIMAAETIHSIHASKFQVNGSTCGFFKASNGIRQGDPLSPFLFVLMAEMLDKQIKNKVDQGLWKGFSISERLSPVSHSQFTDDTILFGYASEREALVIGSVLEAYEKESSKKMQEKIVRVLQFGQGAFPIHYLRVPLFAGKVDFRLWEEVVNKCRAKTDLWKNKWLSQGSSKGIVDNGWPIKKVHLGRGEGWKNDPVIKLGNSLHAQNGRWSGSKEDELAEFGAGGKAGLEDVQ
ncbi:uncharacterized protein LOC131858110 [Cryptomeria japonica]|uniref:uncharacterized protein LOC131858110 n=1 Tax=Cryptomeria japonica TaxID=3369 RepID=UPI0027DA932A|nr:uncharacterized protein LOC131858110 [Cryptomeria japonica]